MGKIRFAVLDDAPALLAIYRPYVEETSVSFEYEAPDLAVFRERMREYAAVYPYLVWEAEGRVLGYAYGHRQMERAAYQWNAELSVYVDRGCQGRGIGGALYRCLLELLEEQGVRNVYGVVTQPNEPSELLHRSLGFTQTARFPAMGYKKGQWRDVLWFGRALGEGPPGPLRPVSEVASEAILAKYSGQ